jgi:hypothetical protein
MALLLNGAGLRLLECARPRVKDVDFASSQIVVRRGKGARDRVTMLPAAARPALIRHLQATRRRHDGDLRRGAGGRLPLRSKEPGEMRWRVVKAKACGPHSVDLTFKDGRRKRVNLLPLLEGPVFRPLRDPAFFARLSLDAMAGTIVRMGLTSRPRRCTASPRRPSQEREVHRRTSRFNGPALALLAPAAERQRSPHQAQARAEVSSGSGGR